MYSLNSSILVQLYTPYLLILFFGLKNIFNAFLYKFSLLWMSNTQYYSLKYSLTHCSGILRQVRRVGARPAQDGSHHRKIKVVLSSIEQGQTDIQTNCSAILLKLLLH